MLTRSKKKRTAREDKSCRAENSNQERSSDPGSSAVGVEEMVTIDHQGGTSDGLGDDCLPTNYLQVAWLLREKLNDFVDGVKPGEIPDLMLRSLLDMATSSNIISVDTNMLNPILWRNLPKELLLLVLARLPTHDITRLRSLSREWRTDLATVNSDINQACEEASPTMVALLSQSSGDAFFVTILDITNCKWQYEYHLHLQRSWNADWQQSPLMWTEMDACDGGLVCFMSLRKPSKEDRLCIVVVNLLTRVQYELPTPHYQYSLLPEMVQIKVLSDTKCYKVFVATHLRGRLTVEIYDSAAKQWSRAGPAPPFGSIFGNVRYWGSANGWCTSQLPVEGILGKYGGYDFGGKNMTYFRKDIPSTRGSVLDSVLVKDRVYLLVEQSSMAAATASSSRPRLDFVITQHHLNNQTKTWIHWKSYKCPDVEDLLDPEKLCGMGLCACDGFLMVIVYRRQISPLIWLLDLSTVEWSLLPELSTSVGLHKPEAVLCRAFWNVVP